MALIVDAFPRFYAHLPAWANRAARILTWVALIGLYISPMWLGASLWGSFSDLDNIYQHALLFSTVPILCLYLVMITWAVAALTPAVRTADEDDLFIAPPPVRHPRPKGVAVEKTPRSAYSACPVCAHGHLHGAVRH